MENILQKYADLIPLIEKIANDIADQKLQESQYKLTGIPDHHHNGSDSIQLDPDAMNGYQTIPATTGGAASSGILGNQSVTLGPINAGYGNTIVNNNSLTKANFLTYPVPIVYGHGAGTDSAFNGGVASEGTLVFFNNGATLSGLWVRSAGSWFGIGQGTAGYTNTVI